MGILGLKLHSGHIQSTSSKCVSIYFCAENTQSAISFMKAVPKVTIRCVLRRILPEFFVHSVWVFVSFLGLFQYVFVLPRKSFLCFVVVAC